MKCLTTMKFSRPWITQLDVDTIGHAVFYSGVAGAPELKAAKQCLRSEGHAERSSSRSSDAQAGVEAAEPLRSMHSHPVAAAAVSRNQNAHRATQRTTRARTSARRDRSGVLFSLLMGASLVGSSGFPCAAVLLLIITSWSWIALLFPLWMLLVSTCVLVEEFHSKGKAEPHPRASQ